jgi:hypothetical protein
VEPGHWAQSSLFRQRAADFARGLGGGESGLVVLEDDGSDCLHEGSLGLRIVLGSANERGGDVMREAENLGVALAWPCHMHLM